VAATVAWE
jgi:hypothetical protein